MPRSALSISRVGRSLLAAAAIALLAPAGAQAAVTLGSSLPVPSGDSLVCTNPDGCTLVPTALPGRQLAAPFDGVVVRWRRQLPSWVDPEEVRLRVVRPGPGGTMEALGISTSFPPDAHGSIPAMFLEVKRGDLLGLQLSEGAAIDLADRPLMDAASSWFEPLLQGGESRAPTDAGADDFEALFNADIEPDVDGDGRGDETQDGCPQLKWTTSSCNMDLRAGLNLGPRRPGTVVGASVGAQLTLSASAAFRGWMPIYPQPTVLTVTPSKGLAGLAGPGCENAGPSVVCRITVGGLPTPPQVFGETRLTLTGHLDPAELASLPEPRMVTVQATVSSNLPDPVPANNSTSIRIQAEDGECVLQAPGTTSSDDHLVGTVFGDSIAGGPGADRLLGGDGADCLRGDDGSDLLRAGAGTDQLHGGAGSDRAYGGADIDRVTGDAGADVLHGGPDGDQMSGGGGNDLLGGDGGVDRLSGDGGNDRLAGGAGGDILRGGSGSDLLTGGSDANVLSGGTGSDRLTGGPDRDRLEGGPGDDRLHARDRRRDVVHCGAGDDVAFVDRGDPVSGCERVRRPAPGRRHR
jgi:hypothetical protein